VNPAQAGRKKGVDMTQVCVIEKRYANTIGLKKIYNSRKESDRRIANPARALRNERRVVTYSY